jgi:predicted DNA-binding transcriptional regulator AlpA
MISVLGAEKLSLVEIEAFLGASGSVRFVGCARAEIYGWVERLLCHHEYPLQNRRAKGLLRAHVEHMTGLSRAQSTRLIGGYLRLGRVAAKPSCYQRHYMLADIELLAAVDVDARSDQIRQAWSSSAPRSG